MEFIGYFGALTMGLLLGLIGGGGSILSVPIFVYIFKIEPIIATSYSLFVVGFSAFIGSISYFRQKLVKIKLGLLFGIPSFVGVFLVRKFLMAQLPNQIVTIQNLEITKNILIMLVFALLMILASYSMLRPQKKSKLTNSTDIKLADSNLSIKKYVLISIEGLIVGGTTGFVGAGGGFLIIPTLVMLVGLNMKEAIGTSLMIIAAKSLFGFLGDLQNIKIDWQFILTFSGVALVGILIGTLLNKKINESILKRIFSYFILLMGTFIFYTQLFAK